MVKPADQRGGDIGNEETTPCGGGDTGGGDGDIDDDGDSEVCVAARARCVTHNYHHSLSIPLSASLSLSLYLSLSLSISLSISTRMMQPRCSFLGANTPLHLVTSPHMCIRVWKPPPMVDFAI